jgi:hypothetical protein
VGFEDTAPRRRLGRRARRSDPLRGASQGAEAPHQRSGLRQG